MTSVDIFDSAWFTFKLHEHVQWYYDGWRKNRQLFLRIVYKNKLEELFEAAHENTLYYEPMVPMCAWINAKTFKLLLQYTLSFSVTSESIELWHIFYRKIQGIKTQEVSKEPVDFTCHIATGQQTNKLNLSVWVYYVRMTTCKILYPAS